MQCVAHASTNHFVILIVLLYIHSKLALSLLMTKIDLTKVSILDMHEYLNMLCGSKIPPKVSNFAFLSMIILTPCTLSTP